jgi:hypothetical protein
LTVLEDSLLLASKRKHRIDRGGRRAGKYVARSAAATITDTALPRRIAFSASTPNNNPPMKRGVKIAPATPMVRPAATRIAAGPVEQHHDKDD